MPERSEGQEGTLSPTYSLVAATVHINCLCGVPFILTTTNVDVARGTKNYKQCYHCGRRITLLVFPAEVRIAEPADGFVSFAKPEKSPLRRIDFTNEGRRE